MQRQLCLVIVSAYPSLDVEMRPIQFAWWLIKSLRFTIDHPIAMLRLWPISRCQDLPLTRNIHPSVDDVTAAFEAM